MRSKVIFSCLSFFLVSCVSLNPKSSQLETSVCGFIKEPLTFWIWSRSTGDPDLIAAQQIWNSEAISYNTSDGRALHGYKLKSTAKDGKVQGTLLLAQGNAMLADQLLTAMSELNKAGIEVYVFDYRGYGRSEGKRRLKAIVSDYKEMYENLLPRNQGKRLLYGISFGGIVISNVIGSGSRFDRAVIDSSPSRLSNHGCEEKYDPVANIPRDASGILVIAGEHDHIIRPDDSRDLRTTVEQRGGKSILHPDLAHPFMDSSMEKYRDRMGLIKGYLLGEVAE